MDEARLAAQIRSIEEGRAYVEHGDVTLVAVSGADARAWLHDLVTTDVATLEPGESRPSLLLSPTGRIRAAFHVLSLGEHDLLLAQSHDQPRPVAELLSPYVLSAEVRIEVSTRRRLFSLPGGERAPAWAGEAWRPSIDGPGLDLLIGGDERERADVRRLLDGDGLRPVPSAAIEVRRIAMGVPRFPVDLDEASMPAEARLDEGPTIDLTKGCFLGQEAIAKVRNLGHPTRLTRGVTAEGPVVTGEAVTADGREAGVVTSAHDRTAIVRIRWDARDARLSTAAGTRLQGR
ncbi:MAG TPA: hypothetical protein VE669_00315 [Actinomycetota bacterium]|jgi:folate-binding protein YgfZ|nr:hypothetical protein [Actinomycetota bacterium]